MLLHQIVKPSQNENISKLVKIKIIVKMQNSKQSSERLDAELQVAGKEIIRRIKELQASEQWIENGTIPCMLYRMDVGQRVASKGVHICQFNIEKVVQFLKKEESLKKINPQLQEMQVLYFKETPEIHYKIHYLNFNGLWPIAGRDFVNVSIGFPESQSKVYVGTKSFNYPYPQKPKKVRGEIFIGSYIIQKIDEDHTKVTYMSDTDLKGSIPNFLKNVLSQVQAQIAYKIEEEIKKQSK